MRSIAHIVNVFNAPVNSNTASEQTIVFESIKKAKAYAEGIVEVDLLSAQYVEDHNAIPFWFRATPDLKESVLNFGIFIDNRKLPLIREILEKLYENSTAEYLIYTNTDIGLMPYFYATVNDLINKGHDAFLINRRRIPDEYNSTADINQIYAEAGKTHIGYDTFVFKRDLYKKFILKNLCVGVPHAGNDIFYNIFCFAENPHLFTDKHLTFHIGMELHKNWADSKYVNHNKKELSLLIKEIRPRLAISKFPGADLNFFSRHFKWLMNPTLHYPTFLSLDLKEIGRKRKKIEKRKAKNFKNRYLEWLIKYINF